MTRMNKTEFSNFVMYFNVVPFHSNYLKVVDAFLKAKSLCPVLIFSVKFS